MIQNRIEYYFVKWKIVLFAIFILIFVSAFSFLIISGYKDKINIWIPVMISIVMFWCLLFTVPNLLVSINCIFRNQPALILTKNSLIDDINKHVYKWNEIENVSYRLNTGPKSFGGYIAIDLINPKKILDKDIRPIERLRMKLLSRKEIFALSANSLNCSDEELLKNLIEFHKANK